MVAEGSTSVEYNFERFSQLWTSKGMCQQATARANELAKDGWRVAKIQQGWSGFFFSTLFVLFERESIKTNNRNIQFPE